MARSTRGTFGFSELEKALEELPKNVGRAVARRTMLKAGNEMADAQRQLAPVGKGKFRRSIRAKVSTKNLDGLAEYGAVRQSGGSAREAASALRGARREARTSGSHKGHRIAVDVGPTDPLAHLIEFGTAERFHESGKSTGVMPATPVVRTAFDNNVDQSVETIKSGLVEEIGAATKRLARRAAKRS